MANSRPPSKNMPDRLPLSVVILTLNEEHRLPACLASVASCDDVVVLDSGSTDSTAAIARAAGARVLVNPFVNFAAQRNFAHRQEKLQHPWVFHLDADEQMTPELLGELRPILHQAPAFDGYFAAPRMMFHGRWLRRCTDYPAWQARLVRRDGFTFIQSGHGQREAPGMTLGYLQNGYSHDISVPDLAEWERKHRRYAREEAAEVMSRPIPTGQLWRQAMCERGLVRRRALKQLSYSLPARPLLRFIYQYFFRGGVWDGRGAYTYCRLLARYEGFAASELRKLRMPHHD